MNRYQYFMGWADTRDIPLSQKIRDAMARHKQRYGSVPNIVELPLNSPLNEEEIAGLNISVRRYKCIAAGCMLVGVER